MVKVVNKYKIGKKNPLTDIYIGKGTIVGNPFTVKEFGRGEAIRLYKIHFDYMMQHSQEFRDYVGIATEYDNLVCYCAPKRCHGDILKDWIDQHRKLNSLITE